MAICFRRGSAPTSASNAAHLLFAFSVEETSSSSSKISSNLLSKFTEGDKVEARYGGKAKWYSGKIKRVLGGEKYDIEYDDGDSENGVKSSLIRLAASQPSPPEKGANGFADGMKVEAKITGCTCTEYFFRFQLMTRSLNACLLCD